MVALNEAKNPKNWGRERDRVFGIARLFNDARMRKIADLPITADRAQKLVEPANQVEGVELAAIPNVRKLEVKLRLSASSVVGRFGCVFFKKLRQFLAEKSGRLPRRVVVTSGRRAAALPHLAPRIVKSIEIAIRGRIYSDATGSGLPYA